jgi:hypothetical protein
MVISTGMPQWAGFSRCQARQQSIGDTGKTEKIRQRPKAARQCRGGFGIALNTGGAAEMPAPAAL